MADERGLSEGGKMTVPALFLGEDSPATALLHHLDEIWKDADMHDHNLSLAIPIGSNITQEVEEESPAIDLDQESLELQSYNTSILSPSDQLYYPFPQWMCGLNNASNVVDSHQYSTDDASPSVHNHAHKHKANTAIMNFGPNIELNSFESSIDEAMSDPEKSRISASIPTTPYPDAELDRNGDPKRPLNAFMLYRRDKFPEQISLDSKKNSADISQTIARMWRNEKISVKQHYWDLAEKARALFKEQYPNYKFRARKRRQSSVKSTGSSSTDTLQQSAIPKKLVSRHVRISDNFVPDDIVKFIDSLNN